jgi:hypothetical protein
MNRFYVKFVQIGSLTSRVFQQLFMAMKKAGATAVASIFVALSIQASVLNTIDFVIKVLVIFMYILMALVFIFFLPILPLLVIVIITVAGIETAMPGTTGPMGSVFCFHKHTNIVMKTGEEQHISTLKPGDRLRNNILVQAVIEVPGEQLYDLDGILVSGYHCVYHEDGIIYVKDHPRAKKSVKSEETLWTLITNKREIPIMGSNGILRFLDWDEIPDSREAEKAWEMVAFGMLNGSHKLVNSMVPTSAPCLDRSLKVWMYQGGWRPLHAVKVGDWIYGKDEFVKVIGICERIVHTAIGVQDNRITDGNWILHGENEWKHPVGKIENVTWQGIQLITDLGYFKVQMLNGQEYLVRDFTEVGAQQILSSHARVESLLEEQS